MRKFIIKRIKFKEWHHYKGDERNNSTFSEYATAKRKAKKTVAKAQKQMKKSLDEKLNIKGQKLMGRVAKRMANEKQDVTVINCLRNEDGSVVVEPESVKKKWKEYMERLMNVENTWHGKVEADVMEESIKCIIEMEVKNTLSAIKLGKAPGPTDVSSEMLLAARQKGKKLLVNICNFIITEKEYNLIGNSTLLYLFARVKVIHCNVPHIDALS